MVVYDEMNTDAQALHQYHEYKAALAWCAKNNKKSWACMMYNQASEDGLRWPLITERGLRRRYSESLSSRIDL